MILNSYPVNLQDEYDCTPIYLAAQNGHYDMLQELLGFSANPNDQTSPALMEAASKGLVEIVQLLMPLTDRQPTCMESLPFIVLQDLDMLRYYNY